MVRSDRRKTNFHHLDKAEDGEMCHIYFRSGPLVGSELAMTADRLRTMLFSLEDNPIKWGGLWEYGIPDALAGPI